VFVGDRASNPRIIGSGNSAVKEWDIADFTGVEITSTFRARIHKGANFKVSTTADDNVLSYVRVSKQGSILKVGLQDNQSYELRTRLEVEITLPALAALDLSGASEATLADFKREKELKLRIRGASKIGGSLTVKSADFNAGGASSLFLRGSADSARISVDGASHAKLGDFMLRRCELSLEGASDAEVALVSEFPLIARLAGASRLTGLIHTTDVDLVLEGASHVKLVTPGYESTKVKPPGTGSSVQTIKIVASGASHLDLARLVARDVEVELSGASHANVVANGTLKYQLSSASHLTYRGEPSTVKGKKSGGSMISPRR
jgi:hypothetical protein